MPDLVYYRRRGRSIVMVAVLGLILLGACWFAVWGTSNPNELERVVDRSMSRKLVVALPAALLSIPALLALVVHYGSRALDQRPLLVISPSGLYFRDWRVGQVPWSGIADCEPVTIERTSRGVVVRKEQYLQVRLCDPDRYLRALHGGGEFTDSYLRNYFTIPVANLNVEAETLIFELRTRIDSQSHCSVAAR